MSFRSVTTALLLCALPALAARPVAAPMRGTFDERLANGDSAGVVVRFLGVPKAEAQAGLDEVATARGFSGELRIGLVKTQASSLAVVYVTAFKPLAFVRVKQLAAACSQLKGAKAAYAFIHPAPDDEKFEAEAYWTYEGGKQVAEKRLSFRDDDTFVQWARKRVPLAELEAKKWSSWPLSELTISLGLPGRDFFERPRALLELATYGFPRDVGENLKLVVFYLPDATVLEIRQLAEKENASPSHLVQQTLSAAATGQKLGEQVPTSGRAPWDDEMPQADKSQYRPLEVFLTREIFNQLDARATEEAVPMSKLVEYAWRQAHPFGKAATKP